VPFFFFIFFFTLPTPPSPPPPPFTLAFFLFYISPHLRSSPPYDLLPARVNCCSNRCVFVRASFIIIRCFGFLELETFILHCSIPSGNCQSVSLNYSLMMLYQREHLKHAHILASQIQGLSGAFLSLPSLAKTNPIIGESNIYMLRRDKQRGDGELERAVGNNSCAQLSRTVVARVSVIVCTTGQKCICRIKKGLVFSCQEKRPGRGGKYVRPGNTIAVTSFRAFLRA
jgi:hypothetical protein